MIKYFWRIVLDKDKILLHILEKRIKKLRMCYTGREYFEKIEKEILLNLDEFSTKIKKLKGLYFHPRLNDKITHLTLLSFWHNIPL
jgi:hypothetical protein